MDDIHKSNKQVKIALLSGAIKNSGDYLIVKRCKEHLSYMYPQSTITEFSRLSPLDEHLEQINQNDILMFGGGPGYLPNCYPDHMPLVKNLNEIKVPIFSLGMGWFGPDSRIQTLYHYLFTDKTKELFQRIEADSGFLGCRDWFAVNVLRNNGICSGVMTGCPAWYQRPYVDQGILSHNPVERLQKICISDPANPRDVNQAILLIEYLKNAFTKVKLQFIFHKGFSENSMREQSDEINVMNSRLLRALERRNIEYVDISDSDAGFAIYDDCDLHIGYRVHAHIYNLSRRNASILIEEDGRGAGVNNALGLEPIQAYLYTLDHENKSNKEQPSIIKTSNNFLAQEMDDYLSRLWNTEFSVYNKVFETMIETYKKMLEHIKTIDNII